MAEYIIPIWPGLLRDGHPEKMDRAIWLYVWLLDKMTKIDSEGNGKIWGGKPVKYDDVGETLGISMRSYRRDIKTLEDEGYIVTLRTPYGLVISVTKAKKFYGKTLRERYAKTGTSLPKRDVSHQAHHPNDSGTSLSKSGTSNKTITKDNNIRQNNKGEKVKPEEIGNALVTNQLKPKQKRDGNIDELIDFFHDRFDLKMKRMGYQRIAASNLIKRYEKSNVLKAIDAAAIVRTERYAPQILSLEDLWSKWDKLAAFYKRNQPQSTNIDLDKIV